MKAPTLFKYNSFITYKLIIIIIFILSNVNLYSQLNDSAFFFVRNCQTNKGIVIYENKLKKFKYKSNLDKAIDLYNLACSYSIKDSKKKALKTLKMSLLLDSSVRKSFYTDPDFYNLITEKEWTILLNQFRPSEYKKIEGTLFYNLSKISIQDQTFYEELRCTEMKYGFNSEKSKKIWRVKDSLNKNNILFLNKINENINVLSNKCVGQNLANHCFLIVQHSDTSVMNKYLPIIKDLYNKGETTGENYALIPIINSN